MGEKNSKNNGNIQSLRPSGFAPAFGRAVGRFAAGLDAGLKPSSNPKSIEAGTCLMTYIPAVDSEDCRGGVRMRFFGREDIHQQGLASAGAILHFGDGGSENRSKTGSRWRKVLMVVVNRVLRDPSASANSGSG